MNQIDLILKPKDKDIGGFIVHRLLPNAQRHMVGPFIFFDHMGPKDFAPGEGIDVRPHPHIGLATVTYLFQGELVHADTLGSRQTITPGAVNWMTAGCGIAHSERTNVDERGRVHHAHGLQSWIALPKQYEENPPEFYHHPAESLPSFVLPGISLRLIAGEAYSHRSPVHIYSPLFYLEVRMEAGSELMLPNQYRDRAIYVIEGEVRVGMVHAQPQTMLVFGSTERIILEALRPAHVMLLGGDPLPEERYIWWNFVSSSKERIEQAKLNWKEGLFGTIPGDDKEFIPLPK